MKFYNINQLPKPDETIEVKISEKGYGMKKHCEDYIEQLQCENIDLREEIELLQQRIDKAIEYIEKHKQIAMFADLRKEGTHQYTIECDADDLLSILRGEDK